MTLDEIIQTIDQLDMQQIKELQDHLEKKMAKARADALLEAFDQLREGLSDAQIDEITQAMNTETIETVGDVEWSE